MKKDSHFSRHQCQSLLLRVGSYWKLDILAVMYEPLCAAYFERKCLATARILVLHLGWLVARGHQGSMHHVSKYNNNTNNIERGWNYLAVRS